MTDPVIAALELVWGRALNARENDWAQPAGGLGGLTEPEYLAYQARTFEEATTAIRRHFQTVTANVSVEKDTTDSTIPGGHDAIIERVIAAFTAHPAATEEQAYALEELLAAFEAKTNLVVSTAAATLRKVAEWGLRYPDRTIEETADELNQIADAVDHLDPTDMTCPVCEEAACDENCPLAPLRTVEGQIVD